MQDNVWEWVEDTYHNDPGNQSEDDTLSKFKVFRGGSIDDNARAQSLASRRKRLPESHHHYLGFRIAISSHK